MTDITPDDARQLEALRWCDANACSVCRHEWTDHRGNTWTVNLGAAHGKGPTLVDAVEALRRRMGT